MDYEQTFDQSLERCRERSGSVSFFEDFYQRYLEADPRISQLFRHTDMAQQQKVMEKSLYRLLVFYATNRSDDYIEQVATRHNRHNHNVPPALYDLWLETLLQTVATHDPRFDDGINLAWRLVLSPGITYMKFKHDH